MPRGDKSNFSSQQRILDLYTRLVARENISVSNLAFEYGKHVETIKDDIKNIRVVLEQYQNAIIYNAKNNTYSLENDNDFLKTGDIFLLLLLLYQSRALIKEERLALEEKLINLFPIEERQKLKRFFQSYNYYYSTAQEGKVRGKINTLFEAILEQKHITFQYKKSNEIKDRYVKPLTIEFHDHQFYLIAKFVDKDFKNPTPFRLDKIHNIEKLNERFKRNQAVNYFKPGEYSNQSFNMYSGEEVTVRLKVDKNIEEYVYRKFPMVDKVNIDDKKSIFDIKVLGTEGIIFWILGQQDRVEVLSPMELREEVKSIISNMSKVYE